MVRPAVSLQEASVYLLYGNMLITDEKKPERACVQEMPPDPRVSL